MLKLVDIFAYLSVLLRAGTLVFQSLLLGGALFVLWIARPSAEISDDSLRQVRVSCFRWLRMAAIALAIVQAFYLYVNSAVLMVTAEIGLAEVAGASFFISGSVILVAALLLALCAGPNFRSGTFILPALVAVVLTASIFTNHAFARMEGRAILVPLTFLHEAATGFWIGGLPFLILALVVAKAPATQWYITQRFSRMALVSVAVLVLSGVGMSLAYIGSVRSLLGTSYGVMVGGKVTMLVALLALGAVNFRLLRRNSPDAGIPRLRRIVEAEVGIGLTVVLAAASLTSQPPAVDLVNDTVTLHQIAVRMKPTWPRLGLEALAASRSAASSTPAPPAPVSIDGVPLTAKNLADIAESEMNHHWMGLIVLAMGILALLARTGKAKWAEYWPLLLIAIAIFILLRADTEAWPFGPQSFWATCLRPEDLQHRLAAMVCIGFAIFELRVRRGRSQNSAGALVFPLMCALGGALLLTHSHMLVNVKEELLAELSHVPMGILAVFAGWSRWLEIRLPAKDRGIPAWIWPACFVLIGAGLLNYREL